MRAQKGEREEKEQKDKVTYKERDTIQRKKKTHFEPIPVMMATLPSNRPFVIATHGCQEREEGGREGGIVEDD
jgi:hypothetical protein